MESESENEGNNKLETIIAILIAVVVVIGALVSWRASLIDDSSGDYDYAGIRAVTNAEQAQALNYVNAYADYGNYVNYWKNNRASTLLGEDLEKSGKEDAVLEAGIKNANDLADSSSNMFKMRYLTRDRTYNVQRQLGEMWADAAKKNDLDYEAQFKLANDDRARTRMMLVALMILTVAPIFYAMIESVDKKQLKYLMLTIGSLFAVAGTVLACLVEFKVI
jgi:hypothetical protein